MNECGQLIELLRAAKHAVVLTGAGISTLSGIPDFRGKNGLYKRTDMDTQKLFDMDYFVRNPSYYYIHAKDFIYNLEEKQPNIVHTELARLESMGIIKAVLTQNIDLLHQKAGSQHVIELHGSPSIHRCLQCREPMSFAQIVAMLKVDPLPLCPLCGGTVKPDIIFFGEPLNPEVLGEAEKEAQQADLMLVLGSSLTVYPAASLPQLTARRGGKLAIVNADPTPIDRHTVWTHTDLAAIFTKIQQNL